MILQSLSALYDRLHDDVDYQIAPSGYSLQKITLTIVLSPDGDLFEIQDVRESDAGRLRPKLVLVPGGAKPSGSGLNPCFLWDNSGYLLGYKAKDTNAKRSREAFVAFRQKHLDLEASIDSPSFSAVCRFLERWDPENGPDHPVLDDAKRTGFGVFQIQGKAAYVHNDPAVSRWWLSQLAEKASGSPGQCLVTGQETALARLHPKVKGLGSMGAAIVSFNDDAYESYGKKQSYNAPVSEDVAFRYVTALSALLDGPMKMKHRFSFGDATVAFWTDQPTVTEDIFAQFISRGSGSLADAPSSQDEGLRQKIEAFLRALREGREAYADMEDDVETTPYCLLGLSPNRARLSVRFFHQGTLADLVLSLRRHYLDIGLTRRAASSGRRGDPEFPAIQQLLDQTCPVKERRPDRDKIPPVLAGPLLRAVVAGARYPEGLYAAAIRRLHAGATVDYLRACVIKGYLNRNLQKEVSVSLDVDRPDPAYRLGRLFATLEKTQTDALQGLNRTIRESFYSSASATPGSVFPRLLRTYQHHLAKLKGGHRVNREKLVQEIFAPLETFPAHLGLADQGLFAIGYYHQTRDFYTRHDAATDDR